MFIYGKGTTSEVLYCTFIVINPELQVVSHREDRFSLRYVSGTKWLNK